MLEGKNENILAFISILHAEEMILSHLILISMWSTVRASRLHLIPKAHKNPKKLDIPTGPLHLVLLFCQATQLETKNVLFFPF